LTSMRHAWPCGYQTLVPALEGLELGARASSWQVYLGIGPAPHQYHCLIKGGEFSA
jgi:hypothetical protein